MLNIDPPLGTLSPAEFLQEYWQQKPLLIRNAIKNYSSPISADEIAGLACENDIESRLILERDGDHPWHCQQGPFDESVFSELPESHWTLLLQSCNIYIPEFAQLLERFRFIPNWRVDDIMLSYAPTNGSVGPHTDNYDVFLLQAQGKRRWQISTKEFSDKDFHADLDLKILHSFEPEQTWELEPGDMLYLPPGIAHHGVALNDCMTVSIGFRAPSACQLSTALLDEVLANHSALETDVFYNDPKIPLQENPGEISPWALEKITSMVHKEVSTRLADGDWFGKYITDTQLLAEIPSENITPITCQEQLNTGQQLTRNETTKLAYIQSVQNEIRFYCNGNVTYHPIKLLEFIRIICNYRYLPMDLLSCELKRNFNDDESILLLCELINQGHLYFDETEGVN